MKIDYNSFEKARFIPFYLRLKTLVDIIGEEQAVKLIKEYIDFTISRSKQPENRPRTISKLKEGQLQGNIRGQSMVWTNAVLGENRYINKVKKCRIHEVLKEYGDNDLMEVIACYPDFAMFRAIDENFILTRTQSLIGGYEYCDTCYHDKRYFQTIQHPGIEFFNEIP